MSAKPPRVCVACGEKSIPERGFPFPCKMTNSGMHAFDQHDWARLAGVDIRPEPSKKAAA
jgi:hypothetical protein